jgi:predicted lactoylglutathione lyase
MQTLSPNFFVKDINETIAFYQKLGFQVVASVPETGDYVWIMMVNGAVTVMFQTFESLGEELPQVKRDNGGSLLLYIECKNIRKFYEDIKQKVAILKQLEKTFMVPQSFR